MGVLDESVCMLPCETLDFSIFLNLEIPFSQRPFPFFLFFYFADTLADNTLVMVALITRIFPFIAGGVHHVALACL